MFDWPTAALIGMLQGILEWLPVSSSGQTTIVMVDLLRINAETAISMGLAVHIGTALAVCVKYPEQLLALRKKSAISRFYWCTTIISLLVALPIVILLKETFESDVWTGLTITLFIGFLLIITGLVLASARKRTYKPISSGKFSDYTILGLAQGISVLPGVSRSGMTVGALLMRGFRKKQALVFSFLLAVPVSIASAVYFLGFGNVADVGIWLFVISAFFAFLFGYLFMEVLIRIARSIDFSKFCMFFGGFAVVLAILLWLVG